MIYSDLNNDKNLILIKSRYIYKNDKKVTINRRQGEITIKFNKNKYVGKQIQLFPSDTYEKYGIIEEVDDLGFWIKITQSKSKNYQEGKVHFFSHARTMAFKIIG